MADHSKAALIHISGIVQGVGFRPFVFTLAERFHLQGWVQNTSAGVDIEAEGEAEYLQGFIDALLEEAPPLAYIDDLHIDYHSPQKLSGFEIMPSKSSADDFLPVSPDVSICPDCLREMQDPTDRRYRYPFINCTNCGPRFTIIQDIPYDRPNTTMAPFEMCPDCAQEYHDPRNRRFHAQPVACPKCGPKVWLEMNASEAVSPVLGEEAIKAARQLLAAGKILAVKGLGGFHLACDATNTAAVAELRRRKLRVDKAFAVMLPSLREIEENCMVGAAGQKLLESAQRPIVILERRPDSVISPEVAPGQNTLGVMLPYTPLHYLLLERSHSFPEALVMTSGNLSEEPIATGNREARERLSELADAFLLHDREIETRCDDTVVRVFQNNLYPIRRSRGYAPFPVSLAWDAPQILAAGPELKNTFCLTKSRYAFISHHIGELENYETFQAYEAGISHFEKLFRVHPEAIACDMHPDYLATRYAQARAEREGLPLIPVQHHHAHITACMAEHKMPLAERVIGVSFDGTGYGLDGAIWGGEFLFSGYTDFKRLVHMNYVPLPGGDKAVHEPWRIALAWLHAAGVPWEPDLAPVDWGLNLTHTNTTPAVLEVVRRQIETGINAPPTSSIGRLFDAVSSLIGLRQSVNYEAQAAIELEAQAALHEFGIYQFERRVEILDFTPAIRAIVGDLRNKIPTQVIAARFHNTLALLIQETCRSLRDETGSNQVVLSGGVWQNRTLLARTYNMLKNDNFEIYTHHTVPANDGGISLGQAAVAMHRILNGQLNLSNVPNNLPT